MKTVIDAKIAAVLVLMIVSIGQARADGDSKTQPTPSKKVSAEVHATLNFTQCVAKLLNNGLGAQEARQLCLDSIAN